MLASELIALLAEHPDCEVRIETEQLIVPIRSVRADRIAEGQPLKFFIEAEDRD